MSQFSTSLLTTYLTKLKSMDPWLPWAQSSYKNKLNNGRPLPISPTPTNLLNATILSKIENCSPSSNHSRNGDNISWGPTHLKSGRITKISRPINPHNELIVAKHDGSPMYSANSIIPSTTSLANQILVQTHFPGPMEKKAKKIIKM